MDFLGNVNIFPVRVQNGRAMLGRVEMPLPDMKVEGTEEARVYIRPHEMELSRKREDHTGLEVRILHVNPAGSVVKVRVIAEEFGLLINVDVSPDQYEALHLRPGDLVCVNPKKARIFMPDYSI
jgi:sulfate transport system ATP-binding protein